MLEFMWFVVFVTLLTGYAILDGFDLGVGIFHLFSRDDKERRLMLNCIGPVWDGNEVWLVTAGGALFAGFPDVYAAFCSGFYIPLMAFLSGIVFRAVAIEFRSKQPMPWWRWMWDVLFSLASFIIAFGLGVILGNLVEGIPLDEQRESFASLSDLFHPYAFLMGTFTLALFAMHGIIYVLMKTEGALHDKMRQWVRPSMIFFILCYAVVTVATLIYHPHMAEALRARPLYFLLALFNILAIANIPREVHAGRDGAAFLSSCANIACLMALYAVGTFPNLMRASNDPEHLSLTIWNAASSEKTLQILLLITLIGVPLVLSYTVAIYYIFRGKVRLDSSSY